MTNSKLKSFRSYRFDLALCLLGQVVSLGIFALTSFLAFNVPIAPQWDNYLLTMQLAAIGCIAVYLVLVFCSGTLIGCLYEFRTSLLLHLYCAGLFMIPVATFFIMVNKISPFGWMLPLFPLYSLLPSIWIWFASGRQSA